jgi:CheY-like chemotaxis protein
MSTLDDDRPVALIVGYRQEETATLAWNVEQYGCRAIVTNDTARGLQLANELLPAIIFHDVRMPTLDGFSAASRLRCDTRFDNTFLVSVGELTAGNQRESSRRAGFNVHMVKPVSPEVVRLLIERMKK